MNLMTDWLVSTASSRYPGMQKETLSREWRKGKTYFHFKQLLFVYLNYFPFNIYLTDYLLCTRHFSWSWLWVRQTGLPWIQFNIFVTGKETKSAYKRWLEKDKGMMYITEKEGANFREWGQSKNIALRLWCLIGDERSCWEHLGEARQKEQPS